MGPNSGLGRSRHGICALAALLFAAVVAVDVTIRAPLPALAAPSAPRELPDPLRVSLTPGGFVPERITVVPGQSVEIVNDTGATRTITSGGDGTFDSGPVAVGRRFVLAMPSAGSWNVVDDATPEAHVAVLTVGRLQLGGDALDRANAAIPDESPPDGPVLVHPALGIEVTRNRILLSFTESATVEQADAALAAAGLTIVGGNRDMSVLVTEVADAGTADLEYMQDAFDLLRAQPGVRAAAYDVSLDPDTALPRPADPDPGTSVGAGAYTWDAIVMDDETIRGSGSNFGLESARFPQAWNWLDAIRMTKPGNAAASSTIVLDSGFDTSHPDLAHATLHRLCTPDGQRCTDNRTGLGRDGLPRTFHGNAVAGVVGAAFDRGPAAAANSQGTVGGDPMSDLHLVPYFTDNARDSTNTVALGSFLGVLDLILDARNQAPFPFGNLRVINLSAGFAFVLDADGVPFFEHLFGDQLCGPGADDDATTPADQRVACTPNTQDTYLREFRAAAELLRPLALRLAANNVLLVVAAGNDSTSFCATRPRPDVTAACSQFAPISTTNSDPFGYLASVWPGDPPPWVLVEGNVATVNFLRRIPFSNTGGQISAQGVTLVPFVDANGNATYMTIEGTSFAAPLVSAAAGLLSSLGANWATARRLLVERGATDLTDSTTPRLDVYAALLGLPAASGIDALLDVNDTSPDGNRRVTRDDRGNPTGEDRTLGSTQLRSEWAAPDGRIDMRDFRRHRDAWLDFCSGLDGCPLPEQISLDGSTTHPKKDMNLDRCFVLVNPRCNYVEGAFSRVDFNGDGTLLDREFPVLVDTAGQPAARGSGARMTDLDVFRTRFGQGPNADTEGWAAADLDRLLVSADVELRLDRLWAGGATSAEVTVGTVDGIGPRVTYTPRGQGDVHVYTVPVDPVAELDNADLIQVRVVAQLPGDTTVTFLSPPLEAKAGQDLVVVPCTDQLVVSAQPVEVTPGGSALIEARLTDCLGGPVANSGIDFEIASGPVGSSINVVEAFTDAQGIARTTFTYPDGVNSAAQVVARSYPALDGGERLERAVDLGPAADLVVHYRFRQTILDYERTSTNDWGPGEDDCDGPNDAGTSPSWCFTATQEIRTDFVLPGLADFDLDLGQLERTGTITPNASGGATMDESVRVLQHQTSNTPDAFDISGINLVTTVEEWDPLNPDGRETKIYDSPIEISGQPSATQFADLPPVDVPLIDFAITDQQVQVNNLATWGDEYAVRQAASTLQRGFLILPEDTNPDLPIPNLYQPLQQIPTDLALVPRSDSTSFAWDWDPSAPLRFTGNGDGTYQPASWCGTRQRLFDSWGDEGYWNDTDPAIATTDPNDPNVRYEGPYRDPDEQRAERGPDDRAAPRHSGSVTSRFEFVAVVTRAGDPVPALEFEPCTETEPKPLVGFQPPSPVEGELVEFHDVSSYADGALVTTWRFGDPAGVSGLAEHRFSDNGTYTVDFTVIDAAGTPRASEPADVVVENAPPTMELVGFAGDGRAITIRVDDPGVIDRQQLEVRLTSPTPGWPSGGVIAYTSPPTPDPAAGAWLHTVNLPATLTPGVYFVVLSVLDKDGGAATASFSLAVPVPTPAGPANLLHAGLSSTSSSAGALDGPGRTDALLALAGASSMRLDAVDGAPSGSRRTDELFARAAASSTELDAIVAAPPEPPALAGASVSAPGGTSSSSSRRMDGLLASARASTTGLAAAAGVAALAVVASAPPGSAVPSFVVDEAAAATGELVAVRNATRLRGAPVGATFDPGDGRPPLAVAAGETVEIAYGEAGTPVLRVAGPGGGDIAAVTTLTVTGPSIPATVAYTGVTTAPLGAPAAVAARATRAGGTNLAGVVVRFTLGESGVSVEAVTGSDGVARAELPVTGAVGARQLVVTALPDGEPLSVPFTVTANAVPVVDAGGDYTIGAGSPLNLQGSATDADPGEQATLGYEWDLDGDGQFDDAGGPEPSLAAAAVATVVCGGTCAAGQVATVALRVTDAKGARAVDTATVTIVRDFMITINPASATLVPNANVSFTVGVVSTNGFTGAVTLSAPGLPAGVTATFDPSAVTPDGTSLLNLRAGPTFTAQDFGLVVRGTSGTIVREAGSDLSLEFGLIPQCFGTVSGRVTDEVTGAGIGGVPILGTTTAADGTYTAANLGLEAGNAPRLLSISSLGSEFYPLSPPVTVRIACGVVATLDVSLLRREFGAVTGTVTGIDADGTPLGPIAGATYALNRTTGADGRYSLTNLALGDGNSPTTIGVGASAPGFHSRSGQVEISAGTTSTLDVVLRKVCTASIRVRVLDQRTGKPVAGARVDNGGGTDDATTDGNGIAVLTGIGLNAPDNAPATRTVRAFTPDGVTPQGTASKNVVVGSCGAQVPVDLAVPFPRRVEATVRVLVVDDTGAPVPNATVRIGTTSYSELRTGADGRTTITHLLGFDVPPTLTTVITAFAAGLLNDVPAPITLTEGTTTDATVVLTIRRFGTAEGTVRDRATGAPVEGVRVNGVPTGPDGRYRIENIGLNGLNQPAQVALLASDLREPPLYWSSPSVQVTARAGEVTQVPDLLMIRICAAATVRGRVVNAVDRQPIEGALVRIASLTVLTDADGRFVITGVPVGTDNQNLLYTVVASKTGFITAQKDITVSCGADIVVDFGRDGDGAGVITGKVTDGAGNPVSLARISTGFGGAATTNSSGIYTITGAPAGEGGAARDWEVRVRPPDGSGLEQASAIATVRRDETTTLDFVLGSLADDPPVAASFALTIEPGPVSITLAGADPTNDPLTFAVTVAPAHGALTGTSPNLVYTPDAGFAGVDTIVYTASDGTNTSAAGVVTITVLAVNQPPVARITGDLDVDEGARADLSAVTSTDPEGAALMYAWDLDGDGAFDDSTSVTASVRLRDDGTLPVSLRVTDERGATDVASAVVTSRNVAPRVELDDPEIDGNDVTVFGELVDPGDDTFTATVDLGDGAGPRPLTDDELGSDWFEVEHTYAAGGTYRIAVSICDDDGGCGGAETTVVIAGGGNAAPVARIGGATSAPEGGSVSLSGETSSDANGPIAAYAWDLDGDGDYDDATGVSASVGSDDDAVVEVGLQVTDGDGATGVTHTTVSFVNVVPEIAPMAPVAVDVGAPIAAGGTFADPGADEWTATVEWGDGAATEPLALDGTSFVLGHAFATDGVFTVTVEVCDDDDGCGTASLRVTAGTVDNQPPTAAIDAPTSVPEGSTATFDGGGSTDPDGAVVAWAWDVDGDAAYDDGSAPTVDVPCVDDSPVVAALQVTDDDGATGTASATVACTNVAPTVAPLTSGSLALGVAFIGTGTFTDPGVDEWTATVDWGEGTGAEALALDGMAFELDHTYAAAGTFVVTVVVCDDEDECRTSTATVVVTAPPADPVADLSVDKRHGGDLIAGSTGTYTIDVGNAGPDAAVDVVVTDTLPAGLGFVAGGGSGWACAEPSPGTVRCALAGVLAVGSAPALSIDVVVAADVPVGVDAVTNRAAVASSTPDPVGDNDTDADPTTVVAAPPRPPVSNLGAMLTVSDANPLAGSTVTLSLAVVNDGPDDSGAVTTSVSLPAGLAYAGVAPPQGQGLLAAEWTCATGAPVVCTTPGIALDETTTVALLVAIDRAASGLLAAQVVVSGSSADPDPSDNTFAVELTVRQPEPPPTSSPTAPPTQPPPSVIDPTIPAPPSAPTGTLPVTGTDVTGPLDIAVLLIVAGATLLIARRLLRRRPTP